MKQLHYSFPFTLTLQRIIADKISCHSSGELDTAVLFIHFITFFRTFITF